MRGVHRVHVGAALAPGSRGQPRHVRSAVRRARVGRVDRHLPRGGQPRRQPDDAAQDRRRPHRLASPPANACHSRHARSALAHAHERWHVTADDRCRRDGRAFAHGRRVALPSGAYAPRDPAASVLYQVVRDHYETFRRMTERAAHLVDHVWPNAPVRPWVLSLPPRVRDVLAWRHDLCRAAAGLSERAVVNSYRLSRSVLPPGSARPGAGCPRPAPPSRAAPKSATARATWGGVRGHPRCRPPSGVP